jgi:hypothetical protein
MIQYNVAAACLQHQSRSRSWLGRGLYAPLFSDSCCQKNSALLLSTSFNISTKTLGQGMVRASQFFVWSSSRRIKAAERELPEAQAKSRSAFRRRVQQRWVQRQLEQCCCGTRGIQSNCSWGTHQCDVEDHLLPTLGALDQHANVRVSLDRVRRHSRHSALRRMAYIIFGIERL